jgi:ComF family protein
MVYRLRLIDRLLPAACLLCGATAPGPLDICPGCRKELPRTGPSCLRCAMPSATGLQGHCGACLSQPPPFTRCHAAFRYGWPVRELLLRFKGNGELAAGRLLSELLGLHLAEAGVALEGFVLAPVPLTRERLRERGFNQAERVARVLSRGLGLPCLPGLLTRRAGGVAQKALGAAERRRISAGEFHVQPSPGARVLLVDDVVTTGATASAITEALLAAGAAEVQVCCLARAF